MHLILRMPFRWDGNDAQYTPVSDDIPWCLKPDHKITVEDIRYVLSSHYQGTDHDPYYHKAVPSKQGTYRPVGVNRTNFCSLSILRPYVPSQIQGVEWISFGSNVFNGMVPMYSNVDVIPDFHETDSEHITLDSLYWMSRIIAAMADADFHQANPIIMQYQKKCLETGHRIISETDRKFTETGGLTLLLQANQTLADMMKTETEKLLERILHIRSLNTKNDFAGSDA